MKAMTQDRYGSSEVLRLDDVERPTPGERQVLIRVRAAGVGPEVWHLMRGQPHFVRLMGFGALRPKARIPGRDVAGTIEAVGSAVTEFEPGDDVFGSCRGAFAEYACAGAEAGAALGGDGVIARKPENITFEQAAAVPTSASTALQALRDVGGLQAGQSVLVIGASGGVGTFAVQLAKVFEADVTGLCSTFKLDLVQSLGADRVIDYTQVDVPDLDRRYDLIIDTAGRRPLGRLRRALTPHGTLAIVGGEGGGALTGGFERQLLATAMSTFVSQRLRAVTAVDRRDDLLYLKDLIEVGRLVPVVDRTVPLAEAAKALTDADEGHGRGKKVITI